MELRRTSLAIREVEERRGREHVVDDVVDLFSQRVNVLTIERRDKARVQTAQKVDGELVTSSFESPHVFEKFFDEVGGCRQLLDGNCALTGVVACGPEEVEE